MLWPPLRAVLMKDHTLVSQDRSGPSGPQATGVYDQQERNEAPVVRIIARLEGP